MTTVTEKTLRALRELDTSLRDSDAQTKSTLHLTSRVLSAGNNIVVVIATGIAGPGPVAVDEAHYCDGRNRRGNHGNLDLGENSPWVPRQEVTVYI